MAGEFNSISLSRTWKTYLQSYPTRSLLSLKSLWELIYSDNGSLLIDEAVSSGGTLNNNIGCKLEHDIICYSSLEYAAGPSENDVTYKSTTLSKEHAYELLGIDASIASYDTRAKCREIELDDAYNSIEKGTFTDINASVTGTTTIFNESKLLCHDKDSVLRPSDMYNFIQHGVYTSAQLEDINATSQTYYGSGGQYLAPNVLPLAANSSYTCPIYLNKVDTAFRGTLTTDNTLDAYNLILFNPKDNSWVAGLILKSLYDQIAFKSSYGRVAGFLKEINNWKEWRGSWNTTGVDVSELVNFVFKTLPGILDQGSAYDTFSVSTTGNWADLLKHTYIWIKAPFFGDYIQPDVFNQDLTSDSDVIHNNIVLSDTADFNKYDETTTKSTKNDLTTYPYIPVTAPGLDLVTPAIYKSIVGRAVDVTDLENLDSLKPIVTEGDKNENSKIGSLKFAPNLRDFTTNGLPNYFDPEIEYIQTDVANGVSAGRVHLPTIIPSSGNLYADGRIISPTIDELWVYLKQLTEGRRTDTKETTLTNGEKDTARAIAVTDDKKIDSDTILTAAAKNEYMVNTTKRGDIIDINITTDNTNFENKLSVSRWVNNNNGIKYNIFQALSRISDTVTTFDLSKSDTDHPENTREITNFTAWYTLSPNETQTLADNATASISEDGNIWQPRSEAPYSLRELEALAKGNKYNIITLARFIENNYSVVGPLGYKYYEDETADSIGTKVEQGAGSLYQFHRDYNYKVDNPNTFFRKNGEGATLFNTDGSKNITTSGMDASFNDLTNVPGGESTVKLYNSESLKTSKMPLLVENYGKSVYLSEEFGEYSGADIYMAADGTWRYKAEHSRIPILRSRY